MKFVIFEKDKKNYYTKFGEGFTIKTAKEFISSFGYKVIFAGSSNERTRDMIYNNRALYINGDSLLYKFAG